MEKEVKVSVVVTVLNEAGNIEKLVKALFNQSKVPSEIIIVDGGSLDTTVSKILNFKFPRNAMQSILNSRLKLYIKSGNRSVGRNFGIERAKGQIIAVTDAGGYPAENWLKKIIEPFADKKVEIVSGYYKSLAKSSFEKSVTPYFLIMLSQVRPGHEFLPSSRSIAFRKKAWKKVGGYPEVHSHNEDLVFDYNLKKAGYGFYFQQNAVVYWQPPKTLWQAFKQFFRFALGDVEANIPRSKVKYIFLRYFIGLTLLIFNQFIPFALCFMLYVLFSIIKNYKYVREIKGIFWLPVIQVASDIAVMGGSFCGMIKAQTCGFKRYALGNSFNKKRRR